LASGTCRRYSIWATPFNHNSFAKAKSFDKPRGQFRLSANLDGVVAQLVEHHNGIVGVMGSNPFGSTIFQDCSRGSRFFLKINIRLPIFLSIGVGAWSN
jgi:hypothetical protein